MAAEMSARLCNIQFLLFCVFTNAVLLCAVIVQASAEIKIENDEIALQISQGKLLGSVLKSRNNRNFYSFRGIPYATEPERFQPPIRGSSWDGVRNAKEYGSNCAQYFLSPATTGSEDCLYINVYSPNLKPDANLNVMVWIHGGGLQFGAASEYSPEYILDEDVVLVTLNYRLGILGFFSTGDDIVSGNNGLKDQQLALQWVKENIRSFGGHPDKVTIFGESAGGASVNLHLLSKGSEGLFQKAIAMSGSALNPWAMQKNPAENARKLGERLGCSSADRKESMQEVVECLKGKELVDILKTQATFFEWSIYPLTFTAVVESKVNKGAFLTDNPYNLMKAGKFHKVPYVTGITADEGVFFTASVLLEEKMLNEFNEDFTRIAPITLMFADSEDKKDICRDLRKFYASGEKFLNSNRKSYNKMFGDRYIHNGVVRAAELLSKHVEVYPYLFAHEGQTSIIQTIFRVPNVDGVSHADDLAYLFKQFAGMPEILDGDSDAEVVSRNFVKSFVEFAKTGKPKTWGKELEWQPINKSGGKSLWYVINKETKLEDVGVKLQGRVELWRDLLQEEDDTDDTDDTVQDRSEL